VEKAKTSSTAFIFVTTFEKYKTMACSKALQNIFMENTGIIHLSYIFCVVT